MAIGGESSIVERVFEHARSNPHALCLADGSGSYAYAQVAKHVLGCARWLRDNGYAIEQYVLIECDQSCEFIIWMLAAHLAGAAAVPLEKNTAAARRAEIARDTGAVLHIGKDRDDALISSGVAFAPMASARELAVGDELDFAFPDADATAEILFSTGTTGKSKGIVITHRNNTAIAENIICGVEMKPGNVEIVPMPLSHSHGLRTVYANLANGSAAVICDGVLALKKLFNLMDEYRVTSMDLSPSILSIIFKLSKDRLGQYADVLDYVQLGSAPLPEDDKERLRTLLPKTRLYNFYGSTEAGRSCVMEFGQNPDRPSCIGKPAVNARFIVVDEARQPIASSPDNLGLLASAGPINMRCYFNAPELTAETMQDGYIYTKDLGYIDEDGYVYMLGRKDDVINFGGVKISPEEIESAVANNPIVADCACIPLSDPLTGQKPLLLVTLADGAEYDAKAFKAFLAAEIDANKQPQRIEVIDEIPRTFNGKIRRKELVERFSGE